MKNNSFKIYTKNFKISIIIFRAFDNREVNFEIDNKIEKSIGTEIDTISISRIFILSFDNLILMFKEIVQTAHAVH